MIVKFTGKHYHGYDEGDGGKKVAVKNGHVVEMSQQMADRLEKQFPDQWEPAEKKDLEAFRKKGAATLPAAEETGDEESAKGGSPEKSWKKSGK